MSLVHSERPATGATFRDAQREHTDRLGSRGVGVRCRGRQSRRGRRHWFPGDGRGGFAFAADAAFSLRQGISSLVHPSARSSFTVAYVVLGVSTVFDAVSLRQSAHEMSVEARRDGVTALVRGIEAGLRHESSYIYRVDVVPVGEDQVALP